MVAAQQATFPVAAAGHGPVYVTAGAAALAAAVLVVLLGRPRRPTVAVPDPAAPDPVRPDPAA